MKDCSRLKDRADIAPVPTTRLAIWLQWAIVKLGFTEVDKDILQVARVPEGNYWAGRTYCGKDVLYM